MYSYIGFFRRLALLPAAIIAIHATSARADDANKVDAAAEPGPVDSFHELETKYIFGFTSGADIGVPGEKAIELETTTAFGKRAGRYGVVEQELEFEGVPSRIFSYELSAHATSHAIDDVPDLDNRHRTTFSGLSADLRFAILERGPASPIGLTLGVSPEWSRIDGGTGSFTRAFGSTFTVIADTELVPNRLYAAANLSYGADISKAVGDPDWARGSETGLTGALAYRILPKVTLGTEVQYYRAYDGLLLHTFQGHALYAGPTLHVQFNSKTMLALAFSTQVAGHAAGEDRTYDLTNFEHHRANLKFEVEF